MRARSYTIPIMTRHSSTPVDRPFERLAVVGAGNMGSGIAQKMATEGFSVTLVDLDDEKVARGLGIIEKTLNDGVERGIFSAADAAAIRARVTGTSRFEDLGDVDLVVEAVFEDLAIKKTVFGRLDEVCRPDAILATNTSSYAVTELASATTRPERVVGLHYFYHPAKNRLVEVVSGTRDRPGGVPPRLAPAGSPGQDADRIERFLRLHRQPLLPAVADRSRAHARGGRRRHGDDRRGGKEGVRDRHGSIRADERHRRPDRACMPRRRSGGRSARCTKRRRCLRAQVESGKPWDIGGTPDAGQFKTVGDRLATAACYVAAALVDEGVGTIEDTDIGARVGLRWRRGPFELMNHYGIERARDLVAAFATRWNLPVPATLERQARQRPAFPLHPRSIGDRRRCRHADHQSSRRDERAQRGRRRATGGSVPRRRGQSGDTGNRHCRAAVRRSWREPTSGSSCATSKPGTIDAIAKFTERGQALLRAFETCPKPVVARLHGLALGGGVELALACHAIVATPKASLAFPETGIGIYPGLGESPATTSSFPFPPLAPMLVPKIRSLLTFRCLFGLSDALRGHDRSSTAHEARATPR